VGGVVSGVLLLALLATAWAWPAAAPFLIWPLLQVIPGWTIVALARPRIGATGRLGLAIVLSVTISTHLVYWLSVVGGGYRRDVVFAAALVLAAPLPIAAWTVGRSALGRQLRAGVAALRREPIPFATAALVASFVGLVLAFSLWQPMPDGGVSAGGSNWSDLGVHLSIAQSLNAGNFPPQVPYFAGVPLTYHWFADFEAAIAARAAGIFAIQAFVATSALLAGALALLVHGLARQLLRGPGARRAALLALLLVVLGGGLGWIRLIGDLAGGMGDPLGLISANSYDNSWYDAAGDVSWPYFHIPSVMGTGLLVHRATTAGLPILVGAVLLLVSGLPTARRLAAGWRDRPAVIGLSGLLGALLAPFHFFFFPAFLLVALIHVVSGGRLTDRMAPRNAAIFLAPYLLALPFAVAPVLQAGSSGALKLVAGWESAPFDDGLVAVAFFYLTNLGVPFVLAIGAQMARSTPWRALLGGWALALFLVPNVVVVSDIAFDMNKYFQAMWVAVAILAAWLIRRWPLPAVAVVLLLSIPSPLLVSAWTVLDQEQVLSRAERRAAAWMAADTPQGSVFVTDGWLNAPTDPAGRLRVLTYDPYVANLGYDPDVRHAQVHNIYCGARPARSVGLMRQLGASYVVDAGRPGGCGTPTDFSTARGLTLAYDQDGIRIWELTDAVNGSLSSSS
jgi:hypothetical protein